MKKTVFIILVAVFASGIMLVSCLSPAEKVDAARENVKDAKENVEIANQELNKAKQDSVMEFRKVAAVRIIANKKQIADFKLKIATERKEVRAKNEKKLAELEARNNKMEKTLSDYKDDSETKWDEFKIEFNHDMDELGKAFSNLTTKNVK